MAEQGTLINFQQSVDHLIEEHPRELRWLAPTKLQQKWVVIDHTAGQRREEWRDVPVVVAPISKD